MYFIYLTKLLHSKTHKKYVKRYCQYYLGLGNKNMKHELNKALNSPFTLNELVGTDT